MILTCVRSTLQFQPYFGYFITFQSSVEWTPTKGGIQVFTTTSLLKFVFCLFGARALARRLKAQPSQHHHGACWAGAVEGVGGACISLKTLTELRFESFASVTQRFMRCALLLVVCCGVRLAAVSLYFAKRKDASV